MKLLLVGGTGTISSGVAKVALERGIELTILNRGLRTKADPVEAEVITADARDEEAMNRALQGRHFDCVIDFIVMLPEQLEQSMRIWRGKTDQYIFISSASVYQKPVLNPFITEETPLENPFWEYSRNKIACEKRLREEIAKGFPGVIVRPSLTYSDFQISFSMCPGTTTWSLLERIRAGKEIIVQGDGLSLWRITYNTDFAKGILGLCGNPKTIGEAFHITNDEIITWDQIYTQLGEALGVKTNLCHVSSWSIVKRYDMYRGILLGDHSCNVLFDNSKIKRFVPDFKCEVPFAEGARRCVKWYMAHPEMQVYDEAWNKKMDFLATLA